MFRNYLTVALRTMRRNKAFTAINILGLSIGISASLVIFLIVQYHFSFDRFEKDSDRIYRVVTETNSAGDIGYNQGAPSPLAAAVEKEVSGVDLTVPFHEWNGEPNVLVTDSIGKPALFRGQQSIIFSVPGFFDLIPFDWIAGSPSQMKEPYRVVLTESRAGVYFPGVKPADIIGKRITYDDSITVTVTGIVKDLSHKSAFTYKEMVSQATLVAAKIDRNYLMNEWGGLTSSSLLFVKLKENTPAANVEKELNGIYQKYKPKLPANEDYKMQLSLQPLGQMHFDPNYPALLSEQARLSTLSGLAAIAAFLLLLACIDFINLSTAQASRRAKETGVRKTLGGSRKQLAFQYLSETFVVTLSATLLSLVLLPVLLNIFSDFIPSDLPSNLWHQPMLIAFLALLVVVVSALSGLYPALVLSGYKPALVLKNQAFTDDGSSRKAWLRKGLTVSQFFIAQVFVMVTVLSVKQIHYMINKDMGFRKEAIVSIRVPVAWTSEGFSKTDRKRFVMLEKFRALTGIQRTSLSSAVPASNGFMSQTLEYVGDDKKSTIVNPLLQFADSNYLSLFHIPLLAGRRLEGDTTKEYLVNETLMRQLGFQHPRDLLNKKLGGLPIVGVVGDFNQQSLRTKISPLMLSANIYGSFNVSVALNPQAPGSDSWKRTISQMEKIFKSLYPETDFSYEFFDESIARFYRDEQNISRLLSWATGLAIFISCMGLLGLVMFTTTQRVKEIGVRKVLGASIGQIVSLLSTDFVILVLIAFAMATPVAWWAIHQWLGSYAYRTEVSWWVFAGSGLGLLLLALLTLSIQTIRAASANPVNSLRTE